MASLVEMTRDALALTVEQRLELVVYILNNMIFNRVGQEKVAPAHHTAYLEVKHLRRLYLESEGK